MLVRPAHRLPPPPEITSILRGLLDKDVTLSRTDRVLDGPSLCAVYINRDDRPTNVIVVDVALGGSMSAALALMPVDRVDEWVAAGDLDEDSAETLHEVLNVLAAAHNNGNDDARHVRIDRLVRPGGDLGDAAGMDAPILQQTYEVTVGGYPGGLLRVAAF